MTQKITRNKIRINYTYPKGHASNNWMRNGTSGYDICIDNLRRDPTKRTWTQSTYFKDLFSDISKKSILESNTENEQSNSLDMEWCIPSSSPQINTACKSSIKYHNDNPHQ